LGTDRLTLRKFRVSDASRVEELAGAREVAEMTLNIPYPYESGLAEEWFQSHQDDFESGEGVVFALIRKDNLELIGAMGLIFTPRFHRAELGYWIGKPYWGLGYATEAAHEIVRYGFEERGLNRIYATHMTKNPASGRVMQKLGMTQEGCLRQHALKWDEFVDMAIFGLLKKEWSENLSG
jgi:RimJ/RimL family protein N-acetyltransferase